MVSANRKLTTVFSADVHGYSRLMEVDEEGTFATLKTYRDAMARLIASRGGRVVNTWGDGLIAEFPSVVEAVRAAVDVQNELAGHNAGRTDDRRMLYRVGINLGDVIVDGDDIYGDGVNIAARLQGEAAPGGILISQTVYDQVRNKLSVGFEFLGNLSVKNIDENIPSYAVRIGEAADRTGSPGQRASATTSQPRSSTTPATLARADVGEMLPARKLGFLALIGGGLVAINLFGSPGEFWARWPLLVIALIAGLMWARRTTRLGQGLAMLIVLGLGLVAVNLMSWQGEFWARWPLLAIALVAGIGWLKGRGK